MRLFNPSAQAFVDLPQGTQLLDRSGVPVRGDGTTVNNSSPGPDHAAVSGATYRMVADLADPGHGFWAVEVSGTSGHPGSPHYDDQIEPWCAGQYHYLSGTGPTTGCEMILQPS